jgi:flagellar basal body-associated protein FliL
MNSNNIELEKKLAQLKIKICEKLNEAYENGEHEIMNVLTSLNEGL